MKKVAQLTYKVTFALSLLALLITPQYTFAQLSGEMEGDLTVKDEINMKEMSTAPAHTADQGKFYTIDVSGITELFYKDSDGDEVQITSDGELNGGAIDGSDITEGVVDISYVGEGLVTLDDDTGPTASGAYLIGVNDEFDNSTSTTVQEVLNDLDAAISASDPYTFTSPLDKTVSTVSITDDGIGADQLADELALDADLGITGYNVGIGTTTPDTVLHMSSGNDGDAVLTIEADEDNNNENDNPRIHFVQDGGYTIGEIGLEGLPGAAFTGSLLNSLYLLTYDMPNVPSMQFATDGAARMTIDENGRIGIGTTDPLAKLHVQTSDVASTPSSYADELVLENNGNTGMTILMNNSTGRGAINFGHIDDVDEYTIRYLKEWETFAHDIKGVEVWRTTPNDVVWNYDGAERNFHIESKNNYRMFTVDGVNDRVGIGDPSPDYTFDVAGDIGTDGDIVMTTTGKKITIPDGFTVNGAAAFTVHDTSTLTPQPGYWQVLKVNGSQTVGVWLNTPVDHFGGTVVIDAITTYYETTDADYFITSTVLSKVDRSDGLTAIITEDDDKSNGSSGDANFELLTDTSSADINRSTHGTALYLEYTLTDSDTGVFNLYDIEIQYHLE